MRLDDRGVGGSQGRADDATAADTAADTEAALRYLRSRRDINSSRLGLVGHSYGAEIAPMVAVANPSVGAVVLLAGPARSFRETMRYQWRYRIANDPAIPASAKDQALSDAMQRQDANVKASTEAWRQSIQDLDPLPTARRLRMPVLILHGLTDRAVDPDDARQLERAMRESGNPTSNSICCPESTTTFRSTRSARPTPTNSLASQAVAPVVLDTMCTWFGKVWK